MTKEQDFENDLILWRQFLAGNHPSFSSLYNKYVQVLFAYGSRFTVDRELVKDCIHDVFVKMYHHQADLKQVENIKSYLYISLRNHLINALKRERVQEKYIQAHDFPLIDDDTAEQQIIYREEDLDQLKKIEQIMACLSPRQRKVIQYRFVDNRSLEEIATLMNINYQSVQNIIQRSIKKAKSIFFSKK